MNAITRRKTLRAAHDLHRENPQLPFWLTALLVVAVMGTGLVALGVGVVFALFTTYTNDYVPIEGKLAQRYVGLTEVYDRGGPDSGVFLGTLTNPNSQLLNPVPLDQISNWLLEATISTEDNNFYSNPGVDPAGIVRAAWDNYVGGGIGTGAGGSTLTQQLVKNVYLSDDCTVVDGIRSCIAPRTLQRKLKEMAFSFELEQHYTKQQILEWYLNQVSYADRYVGAEAAAEGYFRIPAKDLDLAQAALLAGIPAAPTAYHPRLNCEKDANNVCATDEKGRTQVGGEAKVRQEHVLNLMVDHGRITREQADQAIAETLLIYPALNPLKASAWIDDQIEPRLVRMCQAGVLPKTPGTTDCVDSVHNAGYKVTSTLDYAETDKAMVMMRDWISKGLKNGCECHNASIVTIDPPTGQIMVYAPNIDPTWVSDKRVAGNIDQAVEINQPGSSFKPAVYLSYFELLNKTPMSSLWDTSPMKISDPHATKENQVTIVNPRPGGGGEGLITARAALGGSQNVGAFRAAEEVGIDNVINEAKKLGITTLQQGFDPTWYDHGAIHYGPSIAVGGANVRVVDMAYMNATIANMGLMVGVPTLARTLNPNDLVSLSKAKGSDYDRGLDQKQQFQLGNTRLPGTRQLDPVTVLEVRSIDGQVLYKEGQDLQKKQVVDAANAWMVMSIQSDCTARFIIWPCGSSNDDNMLDAFMPDGTKIPMGIKTGTQQGFLSANDTLATWMNGYTRYAATAVWVGNADKSNVHDGAQYGYASANTTIRLFKHWMSQYHQDLKDKGVFTTLEDFMPLKPSYVDFRPFQSATTEHGMRGGCSQMVKTWVRTDVTYPGDCQGKGFMPLPPYQQAEAIQLAHTRGIPIAGYSVSIPATATVTQSAIQAGQAVQPTPATAGTAPSSPTPIPPSRPTAAAATPTAATSSPTVAPTTRPAPTTAPAPTGSAQGAQAASPPAGSASPSGG